MSLNAQCPDLQGVPLIFNTQKDITDFVDAWPNCAELEGDLIIGRAPNGVLGRVDSLYELKNLKRITGDLTILGNIRLESLDGMDSLKEVVGTVNITGNAQLRSIEGLNTATCERLRIENCPLLDSINYIGQTSIIELEGPLPIRELSIERVSQALSLSLLGLQALESVKIGKGIYEISISNCEVHTVGKLGTGPNRVDALQLIDCPNLVNIELVEGHKAIKEQLVLIGLSMSNLSFLQDLKTVDAIRIERCDELETIEELEGIQVDGLINVIENKKLNSLEGFKETITRTMYVNVYNNPELESCEVLCKRIQADSLDTYVKNNKMGCNSAIEILEGCRTNTKSVNSGRIDVTRKGATLELVNTLGMGKLELFDFSGRQVHSSSLYLGVREIQLNTRIRLIVRAIVNGEVKNFKI